MRFERTVSTVFSISCRATANTNVFRSDGYIQPDEKKYRFSNGSSTQMKRRR
jgi:hypothetical protein